MSTDTHEADKTVNREQDSWIDRIPGIDLEAMPRIAEWIRNAEAEATRDAFRKAADAIEARMIFPGTYTHKQVKEWNARLAATFRAKADSVD